MEIIVKIIGIIIVVLGVTFFLSTNMTRKSLAFWKMGKRIYLGGAIRLAIGILLLISASYCQFPTFIIIIGILSLMGGGIIFLLGIERSVRIIEKFESIADKNLRLLALVPITLGVLLILAA